MGTDKALLEEYLKLFYYTTNRTCTKISFWYSGPEPGENTFLFDIDTPRPSLWGRIRAVFKGGLK